MPPAVNPLITRYGSDPRWVAWRYEERDGRRTKVPIQPSGGYAKSNDPTTWNVYEGVRTTPGADGVGIIFTPERTLLGIDLDHVIGEDGALVPSQQSAIEAFLARADSYTELSPSGTGLHVYLELGKEYKPLASRHTFMDGEVSRGYELYTTSRFFTVTEVVWHEDGSGRCRALRTVPVEELGTILEPLGYPWGPVQGEGHSAPTESVRTRPAPVPLDDSVIIERMFAASNGAKIRALWEGDLSAHQGDDSAADISLCCHLAFWTRKDHTQMERMWLASGLGKREKVTKRADYRQATIGKAIAATREVYEGREEDKGSVAPVDDSPRGKLKDALRTDRRLSKAVCREIFNDESVDDKEFNKLLIEVKKEIATEIQEEKKRKKEESNEILMFHHEIAKKRPHLLFERDSDKTFWEYNNQTGLYEECLKVTLVASIASMLEEAGSVDCATSHFIQDRIMSFIGSYPERAHEHDNFNNLDGMIAVDNGVLNIKTLELLPHSPSKLFTNKMDVTYDPKAKCPIWVEFLRTTLEGDGEQVSLIQKFFGYTLSSDNDREAALVLKGESGSGKSTVARVLVKLVGEQNVSKLGLEDFAGTHEAEALIGKRLNWTNELKGDNHGDMKNLINFIDGDPMKINRKNRPVINYRPRAKELITANNLTLSSDPGIFRRFYIIPFDKVIPENERDEKLPKKLFAEASGILNWALEGLKDLERDGFGKTQVNERLLDDYRIESDSVTAFISDMFEPTNGGDEDSSIQPFPTDLLYSQYKEWCAENGNKPKNKINFSRQLPRIRGGFNLVSSRSTVDGVRARSWTGIKMVSKPYYTMS